jgi:hypothetical protein
VKSNELDDLSTYLPDAPIVGMKVTKGKVVGESEFAVVGTDVVDGGIP